MSWAMPCAWCSTAAKARSASNPPSSRAMRPACACCGRAPSPLAQMRAVVGEVQDRRRSIESPRVPGSAPSHYAPLTPMTIVRGRRDRCAGRGAFRRRTAHCRAGAAPAAQVPHVRDLDQCGRTARRSTRTISTRTCARSTRRAASRSWCRTCRRMSAGMRFATALSRAASRIEEADDTGSMAVLP